MTAAFEAGKRAASPDWLRAARLLARGDALAAVALEIGCAPGQLSHRRHHDPTFRAWLEQFQQLQGHPDEHVVYMRLAAQQAIEKALAVGNVRVVLWLADRLKLVTPPNEQTSGSELKELLKELTPEELRAFEALRDAE